MQWRYSDNLKCTPLNNEYFQQESIKVDDLLNILWLTNPGIGRVIGDDEFSEIGITTLLSITLRENLPKATIIRELDDNIQKYASNKEKINDKDIVRLATRISHNQLKNIEGLNILAKTDPEKFITRLKEEADIQKEEEEVKNKKLNEAFEKMTHAVDKLVDVREEFRSKISEVDKERESFNDILEENKAKILKIENELKIEKLEKLRKENENRRLKRLDYQRVKLKAWRWQFVKYLLYSTLIFGVLSSIAFFAFYIVNDYDILKTNKILLEIEEGRIYGILKWVFIIVIGAIISHSINTRFINISTINTFTGYIIYPKDMHEIPEDTIK